MRKFVMLLAAAGMLGFTSVSVLANEEADALIKACQQQAQGAEDQYAAAMQCMDEKLEYDAD